MKNLILYMFSGTRGGETRAKIVDAIRKNPRNANQLSNDLSLDYKTIQHHLRVLEKNSFIEPVNKGYGAVCFLTDVFKENIEHFDKIWEQFGNNLEK